MLKGKHQNKQTGFRVQNVIMKKDDKLYTEWKDYDDIPSVAKYMKKILFRIINELLSKNR